MSTDTPVNTLPEETKKPLLSADTLYDPVVYSAAPEGAPIPFTQRAEYDRTNPVNLPTSLLDKKITITTTPTPYPLLHTYTITTPDEQSAKDLQQSISSQFSKQMSPLYLLYRSTDSNPRIVTKDQIPGIVIDNDPYDLHNRPHPLISLNTPIVSTVIQNPLPTNFLEPLAMGAITGAGIHGITSMITNSSLNRNIPHVSSNQINLHNFPPHVLQSLASSRLYRSLSGPSLAHSTALWGGFFLLRHVFLTQDNTSTKTTSSNVSDGDLNPAFAIQGSIQAVDSPYCVDLPYALSIKVPDMTNSPSTQILASLKAAAIVTPISFIVGAARYAENISAKLINFIGQIPPELAPLRDKLNPKQFATFQPNSISADDKIFQRLETITWQQTQLNLPRVPFPQYGIINKRVYEAFFYDHACASTHLYSHYETRILGINKQNLLQYWTQLLSPTVQHTRAYDEILSRVGNAPTSTPLHLDKLLGDPLLKPPVWLTSSSRLKFQLTIFACTLATVAHLATTIFSYEFAKSRQLNTSGNPQSLRKLFTSENPNDQLNTDKLFQNEIMHVPNLGVHKFTQYYQLYKNSGTHRQDVWGANKEIELNEMASTAAKLQGIRNQSEKNLNFTQWLQGLRSTNLTTPPNENTTGKHTNSFSQRIVAAGVSALFASLVSSLFFFPFANAQTRTLIKNLTTLRPSVRWGAFSYTGLSACIHILIISALALQDIKNFNEQQSALQELTRSHVIKNEFSSNSPRQLLTINEGTDAKMRFRRDVVLRQLRQFTVHAESHIASEQLILPTQNPGFYEQLQTDLYLQPTQEASYLTHRSSSLPQLADLPKDELMKYLRLARYTPQLDGYNYAERSDDNHGHSHNDVKYILKRGHYILPFQSLPKNCTDCLAPVTLGQGDVTPCRCDTIDLELLRDQLQSQ